MIFSFLAFFLMVSLYASGGKNENVLIKQVNGVVVSQIIDVGEDDALHCKITCPNGQVSECWLCKCSSLPACPTADPVGGSTGA